jgi:hypothetical protein
VIEIGGEVASASSTGAGAVAVKVNPGVEPATGALAKTDVVNTLVAVAEAVGEGLAEAVGPTISAGTTTLGVTADVSVGVGLIGGR